MAEITIKIHGRDYKINSFKDEEYTRKLATYCDEMMKSVEKGAGSTDYLNLTVLTMLQMAHNYFEMERKSEDSTETWDPEFAKIIASIKNTEKELSKLDTKTAKTR